MTQKYFAISIEWEDDDKKEDVDTQIGIEFPSWLERFLVDNAEMPGVYHTIEIKAGIKRMNIIAESLTSDMVDEEIVRRSADESTSPVDFLVWCKHHNQGKTEYNNEN